MILDGKNVLVTGGTGSLGRSVIKRMLGGELGRPKKITVFSRDEAKQHYMRLSYMNRPKDTDDAIYRNSRDLETLEFVIGDVRKYESLVRVVKDAHVVIHAAALKQVPSAEYFPSEAIDTNIQGALNVVRAVHDYGHDVGIVIGISTDKACKPINVMGMTKAVMERVFIEANLRPGSPKFACVRYGNVVASRGSVVPLMLDQIARGGPVTVTSPDMTRFLLSLDDAVTTVFAALRYADAGEIYVPKLPSVRIMDLAYSLMGDRDCRIEIIGVRPGEKLHELLISEEEATRTGERSGHYVIQPMLPELIRRNGTLDSVDIGEFSSETVSMKQHDVSQFIRPFLQTFHEDVEVLR